MGTFFPGLACVSPTRPGSRNRAWKRLSLALLLLSRTPPQARAIPAFEAGIQQNFLQGRYVFTATYFNNLFHDQINYVTVDPVTFVGEYVNVNQALPMAPKPGLQSRLRSRLLLKTAYTYTSTQILVNPAPVNPFQSGPAAAPPPQTFRHRSLDYLGTRWGANLGGSFVGRRPTPTS